MRHGGEVMRARSWLLLMAICLLAVAGVMAVADVEAEPLATVEGEPIDVEARRVEIDLKSGHALLVGDVRIRRGDLEVTCARVEARYDQAPAIRWAKATGGVHARLRAFEARASEAELALDRNELVLRGDVRVSRDGAWMRADEATVDLATNRVVLERVRGRLPVPRAVPSGTVR